MKRFGNVIALIGMMVWLALGDIQAQTAVQNRATFGLEQVNDSLYWLTLGHERWRLPYPVYQFQTGDVNGDGREEALVGVFKSSRFFPEKSRRLFVFKNYRGLIRPLWLGSHLGGVLHDFRYEDGRVVTTEEIARDSIVNGFYRWNGFGFNREEIKSK